MVSRKSIRWALALLILAVAGTAIVMWRLDRREQKAAAALARKNSKSSSSNKVKTPPPEEPSDEPKAPPSPKPPKATVLGTAAKEHLAEKSFITALRAACLWRTTQPASPETNQAFLEKLSVIPVNELPSERKAAWLSLLEAWQSIDQHSGTAQDPQIKAQGRKAADTLNLMLKAHGDLDLLF